MTPEFYALVALGLVVLWQSGVIVNSIHIAAVERRKDHEEMLAAIEDMAKDIGTIELLVSGIDNSVNPPNLSDYE